LTPYPLHQFPESCASRPHRGPRLSTSRNSAGQSPADSFLGSLRLRAPSRPPCRARWTWFGVRQYAPTSTEAFRQRAQAADGRKPRACDRRDTPAVHRLRQCARTLDWSPVPRAVLFLHASTTSTWWPCAYVASIRWARFLERAQDWPWSSA